MVFGAYKIVYMEDFVCLFVFFFFVLLNYLSLLWLLLLLPNWIAANLIYLWAEDLSVWNCAAIWTVCGASLHNGRSGNGSYSICPSLIKWIKCTSGGLLCIALITFWKSVFITSYKIWASLYNRWLGNVCVCEREIEREREISYPHFNFLWLEVVIGNTKCWKWPQLQDELVGWDNINDAVVSFG